MAFSAHKHSSFPSEETESRPWSGREQAAVAETVTVSGRALFSQPPHPGT